LSAANECNQQLQVALQNEKLAAAATARSLEGKLADTEDCLLQKVREVANARDVQTGLRIELDSLQTMIANEEDRYTIQYDTRCYINVRSKANVSQLNLPHATDN